MRNDKRSHLISRVLPWFEIATITVLTVTSCSKPSLVVRDGQKYAVEQRDEELFVYVEYTWKGGRFDDAVELEKAFTRFAEEKGTFVYAMGRFPTSRLWQLGYVARELPTETEFQGREIKHRNIPAGNWASITLRGHTDYMFFYWKKFAKWLKKDGREVKGPVLEIYPEIMKTELDSETSEGMLRYRLVSSSGQ